MDLDQILSSLIYLSACFAVFVAGHLVFVLFRRSYSIKSELVEKDNAAFALVLCGYYLGLTFARRAGILLHELLERTHSMMLGFEQALDVFARVR